MGVAHDLAPELDAAAVGELDLLDAAADPGPGLEHRDLRSARLEVARGGQAGQARAHDDDVRPAHEHHRRATRARPPLGAPRRAGERVATGPGVMAGRAFEPGR